MATNLNQNTDCCETSCDYTTVNTPGPQGATGATGSAGTNGSDGNNGYSVTTQSFVIPSSGAINLPVDHTGWIAATSTPDSQVVFVGGAGHFLVSGKGTTHITVTFLSYPGDPGTAGDTITLGAVVSPAGLQGPAGADGQITGLDTKGQLATFSTAAAKLNVGANGTTLFADSAQALGLNWKQPAFSDLSGTVDLGGSQVSGQLDIGGSNTTGTLPLASLANSGGVAGDIAYWNGSNWVRLSLGSSGQVLSAGASAPQWSTSAGVSFAAKGKTVSTNTGASNTTLTWDTNVATAQLYSNAVKEMTVTFTNSVDDGLPLFAFYLAADGSYANAVVKDRTTTGATFESALAGLSQTFVFYIFNN